MIPILYEDNHCLAVDKPAGLLSQGDATGHACVVDVATEYIRHRYNKPGNVYVGLIHRLDRPVSGVLILAKTSKAASRLSEQFRGRDVQKTYLAVVEGSIQESQGTWTDHLLKEEKTNHVSVVEASRGVPASLDFRVIERRRGLSLIELHPTTGRGHQLRVQLASRGLPIVGDKKYGASQTLHGLDGGFRVALHAAELAFQHPTRAEPIMVSSPLPGDWPTTFQPVA